MKKIDHVRKIVYIIVGILTIILLVFSLCKKVGLCAESSNSPIEFDPLPYIYGNYIGYSDDPNSSIANNSRILSCIDTAINNYSGYVDSMGYLVQERNNGGIQVAFFTPDSNGKIVLPDNSSDFTHQISFTCTTSRLVYWSNNSVSDVGTSFLFKPSNAIETINGQTIYKTNTRALGYVLYIHNPQLFVDSEGNQYFATSYEPDIPIGPIGHSKGGVLSNYIDSHELLEDSSDLPEVDTTQPSDPTTNNLLQKILNGLGVINGSIQSGVLTIGDFIGQGFENVINWFTEPFDSEQFNSDLNQIALINDFSNLKTQVENCGMFDWSDVTPAQSLSFTFDVGGAVLPHTSCVVDFSWYTGLTANNIRQLVNNRYQ